MGDVLEPQMAYLVGRVPGDLAEARVDPDQFSAERHVFDADGGGVEQGPEALLGLEERLVRHGRLSLRRALRGQVGQHQAAQQHAVEVEAADRQQDRDRRALGAGQHHLAPGAVPGADLEQPGE